MNKRWFQFLRSGLSRKLSADPISSGRQVVNPRLALRNLKPFIVRHWRRGLVGAAVVLVANLLTFPQPLINRYLVDDVILAKRLDLLPVVVLLLGGVKILSMAAGILQQYTFTRFEQEVTLDIQENLLDHALQLPKSFFDEKEIGYLISRLSSDVDGLRWFFSSNIVYIFSNILRFIGGVAFLMYLEWRLGLVTLLILPVLVISVRYFSERLRILSRHGMEQRATVIKRFQETLVSIPLIKAFASEQREGQRVMDEVRNGREIAIEQTVVGSMANLVLNVVPDLSRAVVLVVGAYLAIRGDWTLGSLFAFQSYLGYVYSPALFLAQANLQLQDALVALERVTILLDILPEPNIGTGQRVEHLAGGVQFNHVSFSYDGEEQVLEDISFQVKPGEHIAIAGPSGVGKTTLVSLILCFYRPNQGDVLFDGQPSNQFELNALRRRIGYVSQATQLLAGTIHQNLVYGNPDATRAQVEEAARVAGIHEFIASLPEGYDSLVDERGMNFSEGQKQRLAIARALVKDPDILILDEPTSALDSLVERSIFDSLPAAVSGKTLFVVAHRLSTIQKADRILLLKDKHLVASGTHTELLAGDEYYRSLFQ